MSPFGRRARAEHHNHFHLSLQLFDGIDVVLHRLIAALTFNTIPRIPFGAAHHVAKAGLFLSVVAGAGLFEERIELEFGAVTGVFRQFFHIGLGLFELLF